MIHAGGIPRIHGPSAPANADKAAMPGKGSCHGEAFLRCWSGANYRYPGCSRGSCRAPLGEVVRGVRRVSVATSYFFSSRAARTQGRIP
jgi:hypothetical protein